MPRKPNRIRVVMTGGIIKYEGRKMKIGDVFEVSPEYYAAHPTRVRAVDGDTPAVNKPAA